RLPPSSSTSLLHRSCDHPTLHSFPHDALPISLEPIVHAPCALSKFTLETGYCSTSFAPAICAACTIRASRKMRLIAITGGLCRRSEEHTSELQSLAYLVCRLLLEKKKRLCGAT